MMTKAARIRSKHPMARSIEPFTMDLVALSVPGSAQMTRQATAKSGSRPITPRAHTTDYYDDQGRVYLEQTFSIDQTNGTISTNSLNTNSWYNHRGEVIKVSQPGGLVSKAIYDGAGRATKSYTTDGGGDTSWSD